MPLFKSETYGSRLLKSSREFIYRSSLFVATSNYKICLPPDPRRVWFSFTPSAAGLATSVIRFMGQGTADSITLSSANNYPFILSLEKDFALTQLGFEAKDSAGASYNVTELLYTGR